MRVPAVYQMTGFSSVMHLLVDGICVCCMYLMASSFSDTHILGIFLLYNVLAFLSQPFTGMWADRMERKHWMLLVSAVLLTLAVLATSVVMNVEYCSAGMPVVAALLGVGNSLFHVWGGRQVAVGTGNNIRALGVFVATGALGLSLGMVFFSWPLLYLLLISFCLLAVACLNADEPEASADAAFRSAVHGDGGMRYALDDCFHSPVSPISAGVSWASGSTTLRLRRAAPSISNTLLSSSIVTGRLYSPGP